MRLLLDTHTLLWVLDGSPRLSIAATRALSDNANEKIVSVASFWEMTIKSSLGKLRLNESPYALLARFDSEGLATILPIGAAHLAALHGLPPHPDKHRDPFDRMLVAQALAEDLTLVSADPLLDAYGVKRLWS